MSERQLVERAQAAVGDTDTIVAAAWFQPRGTSGGTYGGLALGSTIGDIAGNGLLGAVGGMAGSVAGYEVERHADDERASAGGQVHRIPFESLVAVSERRIYAWSITLHGGHIEPNELVFSLDRDRIAVTVHSRVAVRTFSVRDEDSGAVWELESARLNGHLKFILAALHPDEEPAPATS
jgi:hypothetical protein